MLILTRSRSISQNYLLIRWMISFRHSKADMKLFTNTVEKLSTTTWEIKRHKNKGPYSVISPVLLVTIMILTDVAYASLVMV